MAEDSRESGMSLVEPFFSALIARDPGGRSWLPALLDAAPRGRETLGDLVDEPGSLDAPLAVIGAAGRFACFDHRVAPSRALLRWYVDHPDRLTWPPDAGAAVSAHAERLRRALLYDDPPGSQAKAQERANELIDASRSLSPEWWRLEDAARLDCALTSHRLAVTIVGKGRQPLAPASPWYPARSELVRSLEAARRLGGEKPWATLLISELPLVDGSDEYLERTLAVAAPHLSAADREALHAAYLGNVTWDRACEAVGLERDALSRSA